MNDELGLYSNNILSQARNKATMSHISNELVGGMVQ